MKKKTRLPMLLGALLICLLCVSPDGTTWGQRPPIKIGFVTDLTGTAAQAAKDMVNGLTMYLDEIGYQMAGRKVELIVEDSQSRPDMAISKVRKLVEHDNVHILTGLLFGNIATAVGAKAEGCRMRLLCPITPTANLTRGINNDWFNRTTVST